MRQSAPAPALLPRQDLPALTGARGPAALAVVAYHLPLDQNTLPHSSWLGLETLFARGDLGVDFFFILSGFIIHHVYRNVFAGRVEARDVRRFVLYRFARIWPLHMVTMLAALLLYSVAVLVFHRSPPDAESYAPLSLLLNLLMVQSWFGFASPNVPAWSISAEWAAYLAFPFLCRALLRLPTAGWMAVGALALLATGTELAAHPIGRVACGFTLGLCLREAEGRWALSRRLGRWTGLALLAAVVAGCVLLPRTAPLPFAALFAALILALCNPRDLLGRAAALPAAVYLGEISFALYMCHAVVWSAFKNAARIAAPDIHLGHTAPVLIGVALSLLTAAALYQWVELRARRWMRGKGGGAPEHGGPGATAAGEPLATVEAKPVR